tara:strand:+ start:255 stop:479 length:225 start_codon:yes stop_codon:yes gene_type:complete
MKTEFNKYLERCERFRKSPEGIAERNERERFQDILVNLMEASKQPTNNRFSKRLHEMAIELRGISDTMHFKMSR